MGLDNQISSYGAVLNPAIALGLMLGNLFNHVPLNNSVFMIWFIYPVMPFVGALLSLIFFEFVYKKTQEALVHDEKSEHDHIDAAEDD